jgi:mannitol-specific phosphotransferase system IIBC component
LSYAHIFITYFLVTKKKKKQRNTKNKAKRKNKETKKQSKKKKQRKTKKQRKKKKKTVILPLANPTLNSPGVSSTGPHVIGTGITPGEFLA